MNLTSFSFPTKMLYGAGALGGLRGILVHLGVKRPLVVTDGGFKATKGFASLVAALGAEADGKAPVGSGWALHADVHANPAEADVRDAAESYVRNDCDGIVAIGGGSPMDAGKAARLLIKRPGFELARFYDEADWSDLAPLVAIPTTAGTGSEVGRSSVITLESTKRKAVLFHPALLAVQVILDPELTVGLPPKLTPAAGCSLPRRWAGSHSKRTSGSSTRSRIRCPPFAGSTTGWPTRSALWRECASAPPVAPGSTGASARPSASSSAARRTRRSTARRPPSLKGSSGGSASARGCRNTAFRWPNWTRGPTRRSPIRATDQTWCP